VTFRLLWRARPGRAGTLLARPGDLVEYPATGVQVTTTGPVQLTDDVLSSLSAGGVFVTAGTVTVQGNDVYATAAVDFSAGSSSQIKVDSDNFRNNGTAVPISAALGTNSQIENDAFDGNTVAIDTSSNWSTITADQVSCLYVPTMTATGNTFDGSTDPLVTSADYALITRGTLASQFGVPTVEDYPDGWAYNVQSSNQDTIAVSYLPCIDVTSLEES
jgi:hypothetical protein